jgi:hypothetical protein
MSTRCPSCGFEMGNSNRRSNPDHARYFALVHRAYHQWPEGHRFQPLNGEHLRYWLQCAAGPDWRDVKFTFLPDEPATKELLVNTVRDILKDDQRKFPVVYKEGLAVVTPKSISFSSMTQAEFGKLRDAVTDNIERELGCTVADLMQEAA